MPSKKTKKLCKHKVQAEFRYVHAPDEAMYYTGCVHCGEVKSREGGPWHTFPYDSREGTMKYLLEEHKRQEAKESNAM